MNKYKELVELAESKGYARFHPQFFDNNKLNPDTWYIELHLLKKWLLNTHDIGVSVEIGWIADDFIFEVCLWDGSSDSYVDVNFPNETLALEVGLKYGLRLIP